MKKLLFLVLAVFTLFAISCNKSSGDDPAPNPVENLTVSYSVKSIGSVIFDTITYLDKDGNEVTLTNEQNLEYSFERPSNNIHGKIYIKGEIEGTATCNYSMKVTKKDGEMVYIKESNSIGDGQKFSWSAQYSNYEN